MLKVCIIGTGNYAKAIGQRISHGGIPVTYASRRVAPSNDYLSRTSSRHSSTTYSSDLLSLDQNDSNLASHVVDIHSINSDPQNIDSETSGKARSKVSKNDSKPAEKMFCNSLEVKAPCDAVVGADIVILAIPISGHVEMAKMIADYLDEDTVVIDVSNTSFSRAEARRHAKRMEEHIQALEADKESYSPHQIKKSEKTNKTRKDKRTSNKNHINIEEQPVSHPSKDKSHPDHEKFCVDPCCNPQDEKTPLIKKKLSQNAHHPDIENVHLHLKRSSNKIKDPLHLGCEEICSVADCPASRREYGKDDVRIECPSPWIANCSALLSNSEHLQRLLPRVTVVKAFNTVSAYALSAGPGTVQEDRVLVCGDQLWAKEKVFRLVHAMGMRPVDTGPLVAARDVERRSVTLFEEWRPACWISGVLFLFAAIYIFVRDIVLSKGHYVDILLLKFNIIIAWHALALFTATFAAGAFAALRQLVTGTAKVAFPEWLDKWLRARKALGLMAVASSMVHMVAACMTDHLFVDFGFIHSVQGGLYQGSIFSALLCIVTYSALAVTSIPSVGSNLSWREWHFVQSKLGIVGLALGAIHAGLMVFVLGDLPDVKRWPYYLVPASLLIVVPAIILILIRVFLALPFVSKRLERIRGGS